MSSVLNNIVGKGKDRPRAMLPSQQKRQQDFAKIKSKIIRHAEFKELKIPINEIEEIAHILSDPRKFMEEYLPKDNSDTSWKVKLILSNFEPPNILTARYKVPRKLNLKNLHFALQIGTKIIEWNMGSLALPYDANISLRYKAVLALDIEKMESTVNETFLKRACEVICTWNASKWFSLEKDNYEKFVGEVMQAMGLEIKIDEGCLGKFMENIFCSSRSSSSPEFLSLETVPLFHPENPSNVFGSHEALDNYVLKKQWNPKTSEYCLLKLYDRIMWAKCFRLQQQKAFLKSEQNPSEFTEELNHYRACGSGCPFYEPSLGSIYATSIDENIA